MGINEVRNLRHVLAKRFCLAFSGVIVGLFVAQWAKEWVKSGPKITS